VCFGKEEDREDPHAVDSWLLWREDDPDDGFDEIPPLHTPPDTQMPVGDRCCCWGECNGDEQVAASRLLMLLARLRDEWRCRTCTRLSFAARSAWTHFILSHDTKTMNRVTGEHSFEIIMPRGSWSKQTIGYCSDFLWSDDHRFNHAEAGWSACEIITAACKGFTMFWPRSVWAVDDLSVSFTLKCFLPIFKRRQCK